MTLEKLHNWLTLATISVALLCLGVASGDILIMVAVLSAVALAVLFAERPLLSASVSDWLGFGLGSGAAVSAYISAANLLEVASFFLVFVQAVKLPARKRERDFRLLYAFSVLDVGVAAALTSDLSFGVLFLTFAFCSIWALSVHSVWLSATKESRQQPLKGLMGGVLFAAVLALSLSGVVFVLFPRIGAGFLSHTVGATYVSGVSDVMDLTDLGPIMRDDTEVLRVQVEGLPNQDASMLYLRGTTLVHYEDGVWRRASPATEEVLQEMGATRISGFPVWGVRSEQDARSLQSRFCRRWRRRVKVRVWLKPLLQKGGDEQFLFVMSEPMWLLFRGRLRPSKLYISPSGSIIWGERQYETVLYEAECALINPSADLTNCSSPRYFRNVDYLQLPSETPGFPLKRLRELAETICVRAGANTPYQMARAIEDWLSRNLKYTLKPSRSDRSTDPTCDFLFNTKKGHCELFASAMALMLRSLGVACRVVTGFRGGVYNPVGDFYVVRRENAHAWVEVLLDDDTNPHNFNAVRWVTFDPTPPYEPPQRGLFSWVDDLISYLRHRWLTHVVLYGRGQQRALLKMIGRTGKKAAWSLRSFLRRLFGTLSAVLQTLLPFLVMAGCVFVVVILLRWRRRRRAKAPPQPALWFYQLLLAAAQKRGLKRKLSYTPFELQQLLVAVFGSRTRQEIEFLTRCFVEARYGRRVCGSEAQLKSALRRVLKSKA